MSAECTRKMSSAVHKHSASMPKPKLRDSQNSACLSLWGLQIPSPQITGHTGQGQWVLQNKHTGYFCYNSTKLPRLWEQLTRLTFSSLKIPQLFGVSWQTRPCRKLVYAIPCELPVANWNQSPCALLFWLVWFDYAMSGCYFAFKFLRRLISLQHSINKSFLPPLQVFTFPHLF